MTPDELETQRRIGYLFGLLEPMMRELDRIYRPGRFILFKMAEHRKGKRLLYRADAILAEIARLRGEEHRPLPPLDAPPLIGHPLFWLVVQWLVGICNAYSLIEYVAAGRWGLAALSLACLVVCLLWRVPPLRLARQGKWRA
jgi:hypothetical protein